MTHICSPPCPHQAKAAALLETSSSSSDAAVSDFSYLKKTDRQEQCSPSLSINRAILKIFSPIHPIH